MSLFGGGAPEHAALEGLRTNPVVFDVGANEGDFAKLVLALSGRPLVHAFEPNPLCLPALMQIRDENTALRVFPVALAAEPGTATLYYTEGPCELGSLRRRELERIGPGYAPGTHGKSREEVTVTTLDIHCSLKAVRYVDLLKIDAEGGEEDVLRGARGLLAEGRVARILFEFGVDWQFEDGYEPDLPTIVRELLPNFDLLYWRDWNEGDSGWAPLDDPERLQRERVFSMFLATVKR